MGERHPAVTFVLAAGKLLLMVAFLPLLILFGGD